MIPRGLVFGGAAIGADDLVVQQGMGLHLSQQTLTGCHCGPGVESGQKTRTGKWHMRSSLCREGVCSEAEAQGDELGDRRRPKR